MAWLLYVFASAFLYAVTELFDKIVADHEISNYQIASIFCGTPIYLAFLIYGSLTGSTTIQPPLITGSIVLGFLSVFSLVSYYTGISKEDVSRFIPTLSLNTVLVVILSAFLLGETFTPLIYLGIILIIAGALLISIENPINALTQLQSSKAALYGIITAIILAVANILLKLLTRSLPLAPILYWQGIGGFIALAPLAYHNRKDFNRQDRPAYRNLTVLGILTAAAYFAFAKAVAGGPVSLASTLLKTHTILVFLGAVLLSRIHPDMLHEQLDTSTLVQKLLAILLILLGVAAIRLI